MALFCKCGSLGGSVEKCGSLASFAKVPKLFFSLDPPSHLIQKTFFSVSFAGIESIGDIGTIDRCPVADRLKQPVGVLE